MATSGTVGTVLYPIRKVMDHGFRRAGYLVQDVGSEPLSIALELIYSMMTEWTAAAFPLWTRRYVLLGIQVGSARVLTPTGTMELLEAFWRSFVPYRGACTVSSGGSNSSLFAGAAGADVALTGPNSFVSVDFGTVTELDTIGVLLGGSASLTAALIVQTSEDGSAWTTSQTLPSATYAPGQWGYVDLQPTIQSRYVRLLNSAAATWTLQQLQFGLANFGEVPLGILNINDYYNLPNKLIRGSRPNSVFTDRTVTGPVLNIWPTPDSNAFYGGTVAALVRRYMEDPGTLQDDLEIPKHWIEAAQWRLAVRIMDEIPEKLLNSDGNTEMTSIKLQARQQRYQSCVANAEKAEKLVWGEERTRGPVRLIPSIGPYTA